MEQRIHPVAVFAVIVGAVLLAGYLALGVPQQYAHVGPWIVRGFIAAGILAGLYLRWTDRRAKQQQPSDYRPYSDVR